MPKKLLIVFILIGAALLLFWYFTTNNKSTSLKTISASRTDIQEHVKTSGNLQAGGVTKLYSNTNGIIKKLYVKNGDFVVKGQKIADIQSTATELEAAQAKAAYQSALTNLETAKQSKLLLQSQLESARKSVLDAANASNKLDEKLATDKKNTTTGKEYTQEEIDSIRSNLTSARQTFQLSEEKYRDVDQQITSAQAAFDVAKLNRDASKDTILKAIADGNIVNLGLVEGDSVRAGAENLVIQVPYFANIVDLSKFTLKVDVNETRVSNIVEGQSVNIIFDSAPNQTFSGTVRSKDTIGSVVQGLVTYGVYVTPEFLPDTIKPGMTANVEIITSEKNNVIVIPSEAIFKKENKTYVNILDALNNIASRDVITGITNNGNVEIISGLVEGETIVIAE